MMVILRDKDRWAVCNLRLYMYMQIIISITPNGCFFRYKIIIICCRLNFGILILRTFSLDRA